jgi:hypothetical protein
MPESSPASADEQSVVASVAADNSAAQVSDATSAASSPASSDDKTAASSPAEKPATMLDTVKAALKPKGDSPAPKNPDASAEGDPTSKKTDGESDDDEKLSDDELKALSAKTQRRFSKLTKDLKATSDRVKDLEPKAAEFDKIDTFVRNAGLSPQDVAGTLEIAAALRSNPGQALQRLMPIVAKLQEIVGETLPNDLQQRVDQGYLTEADAKALAKARAGEQLATQRVNALTEQQRADQERSEFQSLVSNTVSSTEAWEAQQAQRDPDWHLKQEAVAELVELAIERKSRELGRPYFPTAKESIELSTDALKKVNDRSKRFSPKPQEIRPVLNGGASPRSTAAPKSMLDVVRQNAGAR